MSDMAKEARAAMKAKAKRLGSDRPTEKVDSSTWTPPELLNADVQTGMRPISRRAYKSGGKVYGAKAAANMGKAPRSGGKPMTADSMVNKDMKEANEEREGIKHIGGLKSGGRAKKLGGGPLPASIGNAQAMMDRAKATAAVPVTNLAFQTKSGGNRFKQATGLKKGGTARGRYAEGGMKAEQGVPLPSVDDASPSKQMFEVYDRHSGDIVGNYGSLKAASRAVDRRDNQYGGYRYGHRPIGKSKGGKTEGHEDVAADKALIKKMVKSEARTGKDEGGLTLGSPKAESRYSEATRNARAQRQAQDLSDKASNANYATAGLRGTEWANKQSLADTANREAGAARGQADTIAEQTGYPNTQYKKGGRTGKDDGGEVEGDEGYKKGGRTARKTGGGVFDGPGYPGKVPGVVPGGRTAHARGGKTGKGKGKTNINIVIASGKPAGPGDMMGNPMGGPTSPPGMDGMPGGMPIAVPPPAGGPPGGAPMPMPIPIPMPGPAGPAGPPGMPMPRKSGGRAYRSYEDMDAGAGSGKGRLEKAEIAESKRSARKVGGRTYSSYKDMDAGAGGGFGRLEKAEIASKTARIEKGNY
jgi:hypothetical protein